MFPVSALPASPTAFGLGEETNFPLLVKEGSVFFPTMRGAYGKQRLLFIFLRY